MGGVIYLGPSVAGRSTVSGLNLTGYKGDFTYPDRVNLNYIHSSGEIRTASIGVHHIDNEPLSRLATSASLARDELGTMAAVLQSHWWDGALVTTYGVRRDNVEQFTSSAMPTRVDFTRIFTPSALNTSTPANEAERDTITYSGVLRANKLVGSGCPTASRWTCTTVGRRTTRDCRE